MIKKFHKNLKANRGNIIDKNLAYDPTQMPIGVSEVSASVDIHISDIFYLPKSKLKQFHFFSDLFNHKRVFLGKLLYHRESYHYKISY